MQIAGVPFGGKAHHKRMRKRPRLAHMVLNVFHTNTSFFVHLALKCLLQVFSRYKSG